LRYQTTGLLPVEERISASPLIVLLQSFTPRERLQIASLTITGSLGYTGRHFFRNAQQALNWLAPACSSGSVASQSWQDKRFVAALTVDDLALVAAVPESVTASWWSRHKNLTRRAEAAVVRR